VEGGRWKVKGGGEREIFVIIIILIEAKWAVDII
jgi:hypothetical protein